MTHQPAIILKNISKQYRVGFWGHKFTALDNLSLEVNQGEILGYLGPNGSGKTTTFKILLDLIRPDTGTISILGRPADRLARAHIGFLPENPYFYMYLTASEALRFQGQLKGMSRSAISQRIPQLLAMVGLDHVGKRALKKFSRGMLQRIGIAQALINDPDILLLDEPMSGLDPTGRKQMRNIILDCRSQGKTVIFSSHILSDVEIMCDRAAIIQKGRLREIVNVSEMLDSQIDHWEIVCENMADQKKIAPYIVHKTDKQILLRVDNEIEAKKLMTQIENDGGRIISFGPQRVNLEDYFFEQQTEQE